jgi:hypothetical protein
MAIDMIKWRSGAAGRKEGIAVIESCIAVLFRANGALRDLNILDNAVVEAPTEEEQATADLAFKEALYAFKQTLPESLDKIALIFQFVESQEAVINDRLDGYTPPQEPE